jgi:hypothetical protein
MKSKKKLKNNMQFKTSEKALENELKIAFRSLKEFFSITNHEGKNLCLGCGFNLDDYIKFVEGVHSKAWGEGYAQARKDLQKHLLWNAFHEGFEEGQKYTERQYNDGKINQNKTVGVLFQGNNKWGCRYCFTEILSQSQVKCTGCSGILDWKD